MLLTDGRANVLPALSTSTTRLTHPSSTPVNNLSMPQEDVASSQKGNQGIHAVIRSDGGGT